MKDSTSPKHLIPKKWFLYIVGIGILTIVVWLWIAPFVIEKVTNLQKQSEAEKKAEIPAAFITISRGDRAIKWELGPEKKSPWIKINEENLNFSVDTPIPLNYEFFKTRTIFRTKSVNERLGKFPSGPFRILADTPCVITFSVEG